MVMMTHDPAFILWVDDKRWSSASMSSIQHHQPHYHHQQHPHQHRPMSSLSSSMTSHSSMGSYASQLRHDHLDHHHSHHHQSRDDDGDDVRDDTNAMMYWTCLACRMPRNRVDRDTEHCLKCHAIKGSRLQLRCNTSTT